MTRSMTAYGRAHTKSFLVEVHSVNRKSLDIQINMPKEFLAMDMTLRKAVGEAVKRGYVTVRVTREGEGSSALNLPAEGEMKRVHEEWSKRATGLGYDPKEAVPFSMLVQYTLSSSTQGTCDEAVEKELLNGFKEALETFIKMKVAEGQVLAKDIIQRVKIIEEKVKEIEPLSKEAPKRYQEKLEKRLEELKLNHQEGEERLMRELVIFSDRIDVTEEITRLGSHVKQLYILLKEEKPCVGKELDFLTQEMNREVNTIAAKAQELDITQAALVMKGELGKIREQLQNLE
ncbi:YicC/YloC family endoribonuclease [Candidatus Neptunochlamydia vexilliferae]|uniref:UPF0701 protein YloC n=1 Tax=Candidatus Neptunichlamydia vexilliferae TaxID=1651774 RepID=A0ABS0AZE2_9BACT|nr:YicC/YloC family endoribonuclease [Candidatus Neptunochlamydia vexilliferae]MBF5059495.1 UPF0701 protein YloC [Candidatus Neptunochlamydia vexilliferae]